MSERNEKFIWKYVKEVYAPGRDKIPNENYRFMDGYIDKLQEMHEKQDKADPPKEDALENKGSIDDK